VQAAGPLGDARRLALPEPRGRPLDLSGGREECEWKYVAPDGTVIETTAPFREKAYHAACHDPYYTAACATGDGNVFFRPNTADEARMDLVFPKPLRLAGLMLRAGPRVERKHMDFSDATTYFDLYVWPAAEDEIDLDEQNRREEVSTSANWVKVKAGLALSEEWGHQFLDLPNPRVKGVRLGAIRGNGISLVRPYLAAGGKAPPAAAGKEGR
jgi:hypothetical protein